MSGSWTVREVYTPLAEANGLKPALSEGNAFSFRRGEPLERDDEKTVSEEKNGVIIRQWFWLTSGSRSGFVPHNPLEPDDTRSPAIELTGDIPAPFQFQLFSKTISRIVYAENCVRKAIRWEANAAYLYAIGFIESGSLWPAGEVSSPDGTETVGTYQFVPQTWRTIVDKLGTEQNIGMQDIASPEPQITFAASQAGDSRIVLTEKLGDIPTFLQLYLAHLFTIEGCLRLAKLPTSELAKPIDEVLNSVLSEADEATRKSRITALIARKSTLLMESGKPLNTSDALKALERDLDRGFAEVKAAATKLIPQVPSSSGKSEVQGATADTLGVLSEEFESNGDPGAIGWDRVGKWSYGKYQISTAKSRFDEFMTFLGLNYPEIEKALSRAGGAAAAKQGTEIFKAAFRSLKAENNFSKAQFEFVKVSHYDIMAKRLTSLLDVNARSIAIQNVVWSVAVQHGPMSQLISKIITPENKNDDSALINAIYDERSKVNVYFANSTPDVRSAVLKRFRKERQVALRMLA